ncbi:ABC transporter permease subunit [Ahrensia sp. 13_GOM-1096m]|uniref:ABC transporter permease subunit n=1 Tax=Ahrensia sp. 13_GOM-1096m TaxID=1380380 RepID=UPI000478BB64|nr:ABC transporter permease subunit [Ahrensia sp. 13_GOM-1096m]
MGSFFKRITIGLPYFWLCILFLLPFLIVLRVAFSEPVLAMPPFAPQFDLSEGWQGFVQSVSQFTTYNFQFVFEDSLYTNAYLSSLRIALISTLLTLAIGFPLAYGMARSPMTIRPILLMLVILPFWTSFLIRVYAWIGILKPEGLMNQFLMSVGIISTPLRIYNTEIAVYIGIVYSYLPFMVLPIYATLEKMDYSFVEAARDLGCSSIAAFWKITARLALPGVLAGCFLVFIPAIGEFVIPELLGGSQTLMIGKTLWSEFFNNRDWPVASTVAIILLAILVVPIVLFQNAQARATEANR